MFVFFLPSRYFFRSFVVLCGVVLGKFRMQILRIVSPPFSSSSFSGERPNAKTVLSDRGGLIQEDR